MTEGDPTMLWSNRGDEDLPSSFELTADGNGTTDCRRPNARAKASNVLRNGIVDLLGGG